MTHDERARVAVVGMAAQFPDAEDVDEFWANLLDGRSAIRQNDGGVVAAIRDPHLFDAEFFGIPATEAQIIDPQHRLFLECCWTALENAGYDPRGCPGSVAVFGGSAFPTYLMGNLAHRRDLFDEHGLLALMLANDRDALAARVSYTLGLRGPSVAVQSFSSTGLLAVHLAVQSLLGGECDSALAGAVSVRFPQTAGYDGVQTRTPHSRTYDAGAAGPVIGNGVGVVVLKRLADARRDGDAIHGVILGSATNNDGAGRPGFGAPGRTGKAAVVAEALAVAGVPADSIGYVEGHGMATVTGDAIEVGALAGVLRPRAGGPCLLGSVTANVGHLETAAGMAGLIKALCMVRTGEVPPQIDFDRPNPALAKAADVLRVSTERATWPPGDGPRRAGVSIFGIGGVNVHVLVEEPPATAERAPVAGPDLVVLSARTPRALETMTERLLARLLADPGLCLGDLAFTLQTGRTPFAVRRVILARDRAHLIAALLAPEPPIVLSRVEVPADLTEPAGLGERTGLTEQTELAGRAELAGRLWARGVTPHWPLLHRHATRQRVWLPAYPFERTAHWVAPPRQPADPAGQRSTKCPEGALA